MTTPTQADRDAAAPIMRHLYRSHDASGADALFEHDVITGQHDDQFIVQAFARHREQADEAGYERGFRDGSAEWSDMEDTNHD